MRAVGLAAAFALLGPAAAPRMEGSERKIVNVTWDQERAPPRRP